MKKNLSIRKQREDLPSAVFEDTHSSASMLKDMQERTPGEIIAIYAYAEAIVETVREPLVILDEELRVKSANKAFLDMFQMTKEEIYGNRVYKLNGGDWNIPSLRKLLEDILPKSTHFNDYEVEHLFNRIGLKIMLLNARRIILEGQKTELILLAIQDITQRKAKEQQRDDFIGMASHELKTPLTSIKAYAEILHKHLEKVKDPKGMSHLTKMQEQINKQESLIRDLLNVSKLQSGRADYHAEEFNLDSLVNDAVKELQGTALTHKIVVLGKTTKKISAVKEHIGQVLTNFLTNAIKYSPEAKKVIVRLSEDKNSVTVGVEDFGIGVPKEQKKRVFDRFYRSENVKTKSLFGYGLGLYIAAQIIKQYGGQIKVESIEGKGSTFSFSLPQTKQK